MIEIEFVPIPVFGENRPKPVLITEDEQQYISGRIRSELINETPGLTNACAKVTVWFDGTTGRIRSAALQSEDCELMNRVNTKLAFVERMYPVASV